MEEKTSTHPLLIGQAKEPDEANFCFARSD